MGNSFSSIGAGVGSGSMILGGSGTIRLGGGVEGAAQATEIKTDKKVRINLAEAILTDLQCVLQLLNCGQSGPLFIRVLRVATDKIINPSREA